MSESAHNLPNMPPEDAANALVDRPEPSSGLAGRISLSPQPQNRSPSPFQITKTGDSIDSSPFRAGTTAKDLYDASPNNTFRPSTSEFTFRIDSTGLNGSAKAPASKADDQPHAGGQHDLAHQFKALQLVKHPDGQAHSASQAVKEELLDVSHSGVTHSSSLSGILFEYSADAETRPAEPFYDVDFQSSLKKAQKLARKVRDCLGECEVALQQGSSLYKLRQEAVRLSSFKCPNKRLIGVVGNSGQGKAHFTISSTRTQTGAHTEATVCRSSTTVLSTLLISS